jgi:hypothetical protein
MLFLLLNILVYYILAVLLVIILLNYSNNYLYNIIDTILIFNLFILFIYLSIGSRILIVFILPLIV